jgi:hypothetical protein
VSSGDLEVGRDLFQERLIVLALQDLAEEVAARCEQPSGDLESEPPQADAPRMV